ncbi:hypothetical protein CW696_03320 [ANME-2 cluster archaeon]|nr:MAG: hypothetical protein CW696_03320 [ANME-2 cluster archaeon]RLG24926.1 MAG: hypothetical protein DRN77_01250 [Methanosarcinales archaeon]
MDFIFHKARYQFELTGKKARDLHEFLAVIKEVNESSIFNHIYHALLDYHLLPLEYPNDFAYWIADVLHEPVLAERLANLDLREFHDLEMLRNRLINIIEDYLAMHDVTSRAGIGQEFHFVRCISVVFPTRYAVTNMNEALDILKEIDLDSIFYYFVASRLLGGGHYRLLSQWILENDSHELMEKLDNLYPYGFANMNDMRNEIIRIIERYFWEHL